MGKMDNMNINEFKAETYLEARNFTQFLACKKIPFATKVITDKNKEVIFWSVSYRGDKDIEIEYGKILDDFCL